MLLVKKSAQSSEKLGACSRYLNGLIACKIAGLPQVGNGSLGVSILSYGGGVPFGVITDSALCPEPQRIIDEFLPEFARLSVVTLMLPWGE